MAQQGKKKIQTTSIWQT